ncbi:response regulator [Faecalicatena orotica]|uniref:response regulator n=1 Tax=Faecalicatena orotica TaxID=1544 RepID=UPI003216AE5B
MYTFIIIDDEKIIREGTLKKLSDLNDRITCIGQADNGAEGMKLVEEYNPDIIILDMQMPVMGGTELLPYLSEKYPNKPLIVISGYRDFDYVKHAISANAIDYILKPFSRDTVQKAMLDAIARIDNDASYQTLLSNEEQAEANYYEYDIQMLENLILGYHTASAAISSRKLGFINETHNLLLLTLHFEKPLEDVSIEEFIVEHNFENLAIYLKNPNNSQLGFIIIFVPEEGTLTDKQLALQITEALLAWLNGHDSRATAGISRTHNSLTELHDAFLETSDALNSQSLSQKELKYYFNINRKEQIFISWDKQEEFLFRVEAGMTEEVHILIDELFFFYQTVPRCTLADVKYHLYQLGSQCRLIMNSYLNQNGSSADSSSMQNVMSYIFSLEELKNYYMQFFTNITALLKPQSVYAIDDVIEKIKIYISRNYQKNLTQDFISCLFYLNRSYLSQLFKNKTNQKFVDYLNQVRIDKAKELLSGSDRKMYQVAKAVGYDNVKYFFRVFKKYEGITPEQYREAH